MQLCSQLDHLPTKTQLRKLIGDQVRKLTEIEIERRSLSVRGWCQDLLESLKVKRVLGFRALPREINLWPLVISDFGQRLEWAFPKVEGVQLRFGRGLSDAQFVKGELGVLEPLGSAGWVDPLDFEVVLVPAVAVDVWGGRLGRGRGYYDRFLAANDHLIRVAVVLREQIYDGTLPMDAADQRVNFWVSDQGIFQVAKL